MVFFGDNQDQQLRFGERVLRRASPDFNDGINPTGKLLQTMTAPTTTQIRFWSGNLGEEVEKGWVKLGQ